MCIFICIVQGKTQCRRLWTSLSCWSTHPHPPRHLHCLFPHRNYLSNVLRCSLTRRPTPCSFDFLQGVPRHLQHHQHDDHPHHVQPDPARPPQRWQEGHRRPRLLHHHLLHGQQRVSTQCVLSCFLHHNHCIGEQAFEGELRTFTFYV